MTTKNKQDELFIINDINMEINPSDVQVMDDNWVMEDSYLRSKAVFCYRSKYSATKVVLSIPFQITHLNEVEAAALNNTYNCIRLITELSSYPFCFIRNQRIRTYISPTSISETNYMMFAVDEINLVQDAAASNMLFLEVVLQYFNHNALIQDFEFKSNLNVQVVGNTDYASMTGSDEETKTTVEKNANQKQLDKVFKNNKQSTEQKRLIEVPNLVCSSLQDSTIWKKYIRPKESKVYSELIRTGLLQTSYTGTRNVHPSMRVKLMAPLMFVINEDEENFDDGRLVDNDCKVITVTNVGYYDNGTYENLLNTISKQDFSGDAVFENQTIFSTNSENEVKQGELTTKQSRKTVEEKEPTLFLNSLASKKGLQSSVGKNGQGLQSSVAHESVSDKVNRENEKLSEKSNLSGSSSVFIQWQGDNIEELQMGITSIKVSKKNKLVSHQISSFKHPIIQYMGKYPTTVSVSMNSVNQDVYSNDEVYNSNVFVKQILNILDYNKSNIPEAEAYNFLKIRSLATLVMGCENYVPSQSVVSASANQQGVENIVYSFYETDMTSFIEDTKVKASGKMSTNKSTAKVTEMTIRWLTEFSKIFPEIMNNKNPQETHLHSLETFKLIVQLGIEAYSELGFEKNKIAEALDYSGDLLSDLRPNNNILKTVELLPKDLNPKELSKYNLYNKVVKYVIKEKTNENYDSKFANSPTAIGGGYYPNLSNETKTYVETVKNEKAIDVSLYTIFRNLTPFIVKVLMLRQSALEGKASVNVGGINFTESGKFSNLLLGVVARLEAGLNNGEQAAAQSIDSDEVRQFFEDFSQDYSNTFFGYNYEDLTLEDLASEGYDRNTDLLVQNIDPFFFLVERTHLDGTELISSYEKMYTNTGDLEKIPSTMNGQDNEAKDNPDITATTLGVEYRKLKEIEYNKLTFNGSSEGQTGDRELDHINRVYNNNKKNTPIDSKYVSAIERALKHYGYENDYNFKQLVYSFLHVESTNGADKSAFDSSGAQGLFQLTDTAVAQLMIINNKVIDSQGTALPSNRNANWANQQASSYRPKLRTDHFFNACCGIEYIQYIRRAYGNYTTINGKQDPVLIYMGYNLGPGALKQAYEVLTGKSSSAPAAIDSIRKQNADGVVWNGNHKETIESYVKLIAERSFSFNNVPDYLRPDTSLVSKAGNAIIGIIADPAGRKEEASNIVKNAKDYATPINPKNKPLIFKDNNEKVKEIDKTYDNSKVIPSKADKTNFVTSGTYMTGYVVGRHSATSTEDGDTFDFRDGKTGRTIRIRLYGIDAPETTHLSSSERKGLKGGEFGMAEVLGQKAKDELTRMAFGKTVSIQDMGADSTEGRRVGKLILSDGVDPALVLLRNGLGFVPDKFISDGAYKKAETEARENNRGIWKVPNGIVFKPRVRENKGGTPIPLSNSDVERAKTPESLRFSNSDFETAKKVNGPKLNNYQPVLGGPYPISSPFGPRKGGMHKGVDIACPVGTKVVAAASGLAVFKAQNAANGKPSFGYYVEIDHGNGFITRYAHLSASNIPKTGKKVQAGEQIGLSGGKPGSVGAGSSRGIHLHYEVRYRGTPVNPFGTRLLTEYKAGDPIGVGNTTTPPIDINSGLAAMIARNGVTDANTVYNEDELAKAIFERMNKYVNLGLKTALPAIKVYITIGNENDKFWLNTLKGGIQYYELKGIKSFSMACNNDANPVDIVVMDIADPSFLNTDAFMGLKKMQGVSPNKIGTDYETQFTNDNVLLRAGLKLHIRVGYGNNISKLDTIFNGTITDINVTNPQNVQVICEGFGKELLGEIFAPAEPQMLNNQNDHMSTSGVIGESLMAKCITHFGYSSGFWANTFKGLNDPEDRALQPGTFSFSYNWFFDTTAAQYKSRIFMNVFAPEIEAVDEVYKDQIPFYRDWIKAFSGLYTQGYPFSVYKMTPWDCLKQMEYRHPNTIVKPKFFEDRMTLFYGVKEQMYFAKDLNRSMQIIAAKQVEDNNTNGYITKDYYEKRRERMLPAVDMHLVTSSHNLINNGLRLNATYATVTNVSYTDSQDPEVAATPWKMKSQKIKMDDNIFSWDLREKNLMLSSCVSKYMSFCYGTTDLKKEAEKMYSGKILVIGNPTIKAGDYVFLDDSEKRMVGLILVRECNHHFDEKRGFITEIVPGQYVEAANFLYSSLWFKLMCSSKIVTSKLRNISKVNYTAKDFNMIYDYLTIMNQLTLGLDKKPDLSPKGLITDDPSYSVATGSITALSIYVTNQLAKILGIKPYKFGVSLGVGTGRYLSSFYSMMGSWSGFSAFGRDVITWLKVTEAADRLAGRVTGARQMIGGSRFAAYASKAKDSIRTAMQGASTRAEGSLIGKAFKFTGRLLTSPFRYAGSAAGRAGIAAAKVLARSMLVGLIALPVAGIAAVVLDIVALFAIQWAFDKMEENKLIRQPLLFFPLVRHGKPYTAGMAGLKRNSWWDSNKEEWAKTINQVKKTSTIIAENGNLTGSENNLFIQLLNWYGDGEGSDRNGAATYSTDLTGNQIKLNRNGDPIVTSPESVEKKKQLDKMIANEYQELTKEQKNADNLKDQLQKITSNELGRSPNLEVRNP